MCPRQGAEIHEPSQGREHLLEQGNPWACGVFTSRGNPHIFETPMKILPPSNAGMFAGNSESRLANQICKEGFPIGYHILVYQTVMKTMVLEIRVLTILDLHPLFSKGERTLKEEHCFLRRSFCSTFDGNFLHSFCWRMNIPCV